MKLRRRVDVKAIFVLLVLMALVSYFAYGLKPAAEATKYGGAATTLEIESAEVKSDVVNLTLENHELHTPDEIVGSFSQHENKTLLIGHSTTVFSNLKNMKLNDEIKYNDQKYRVIKIQVMKKEKISMRNIMEAEAHDTIVLMTCAGTLLSGGDATHRLIITAVTF